MRMILESARVWENCVFFILSLRRTSVWGSDPGCVAGWRKVRGKKEQKSRWKYGISIFTFFLTFFFFYAWMFKPVFPASSWTGHSSEYSSQCLSEHSSWVIPPEKISEMFWVHTGPLCYRPAHGYIDSAGLLSVEECAALHTSRIHGLYFHFAGHFY